MGQKNYADGDVRALELQRDSLKRAKEAAVEQFFRNARAEGLRKEIISMGGEPCR